MKRFLILILLIGIVVISFIPVVPKKISEANNPILIEPMKLSSGDYKVELGENHSSESGYQNTSFEYIADLNDIFSDINGERPFPWGGEIFHGKISFLLSEKDSYDGERCFKIIGYSKNDHGAIAIPDLSLKPNVQPGGLYYLSFWVKYDVRGGEFRLTQQFFRKEDRKYPYYVCYGPWIKGSSNQDWEYVGLLVQAPMDSWKGSPILELKGKGCISADDVYFGKIEIIKEVSKNEIL